MREFPIRQQEPSTVNEPNNDLQKQTQQRYREFLDLLPLTLELAGLPKSDPGKYFSEEQIQARVFTIKHAYKQARQVAREAIQR